VVASCSTSPLPSFASGRRPVLIIVGLGTAVPSGAWG
jgi:hypothetical protein